MSRVDFIKDMKKDVSDKKQQNKEQAIQKEIEKKEFDKKQALDRNIDEIDIQINELTKAAIEAETTGATKVYEKALQSLAHLCDVSAQLKIAKIDIKVANIAVNANAALFDALNNLDSIAQSAKSGKKLSEITKKQKKLAKEFAKLAIEQQEIGKALGEGSTSNYTKDQEGMQTALALINAQKDAERMNNSLDIVDKAKKQRC